MENPTLFLWDGLTADEIARCRAIGTMEEHTFRKGEVIYDVENARRALAFVLKGCVRVTHGRVIMNDLCAGDVFGVAALFGSSEPYPSTVVAAEYCKIAFISQETVSLWMAQVPRVAENYVRFLSDRIRFLNRRLSTLTAGQSNGKLWQYLLAHQSSDGVVTLQGGMSALAERLDMGRSSLYRSLDALTDAGRIRREGKQIIILKTEE